MKNLTRLVVEYGYDRVRETYPYAEAVYLLHCEDGLTFKEIEEGFTISYDNAILAMEIAVAIDIVGARLRR